MVTAEQVDAPPISGWNARNALSLPGIWFLVDRHLPSGFPMSTATFVTICFEETACCNMIQVRDPIAIGPGQLQVSEAGKVDFFACQDPKKDNFLGGRWDSSRTLMAVNQQTKEVYWRQFSRYAKANLPPLTTDFILGDNDFSVKMQLEYFHWLKLGYADGKEKKLGGLLAAQTGGNIAAERAFERGGSELAPLMEPDPSVDYRWSDSQWKQYYAKRRLDFIRVLNLARTQIKGNPVPADRVKFWEFFLPDEFLQNPTGYVRRGF